MSICPQCQFENPDANKFCERCGTSLTHLICPACNADVVVGSLHCPECQATVAEVLQAIVTVPAAVESLPWPTSGTPYDRYRPIEPLIADPASPRDYLVQVYDSQPYQIHELERLAANPDLDPDHLAAAIPALAQPYLLLESHFAHRLPTLQETWQDSDGRQVILIEDRQAWRSMLSLWQDPDTPPLQVFHHLGEMIDLFEALLPLDGANSLLVLENLLVDEDWVLCLRRVYTRSAGSSRFERLGTLWLTAIEQTNRADLPPIVLQFAQDVAQGKFSDIEAARSALQGVVEQWSGANDDLANRLAGSAASAAIAELPDLPDDDDDSPTVVLPMRLAALDEAGRTDIGRQRDHNEDCFGLYTEVRRRETPTGKYIQAHNLYILCDGMGGHASGEVASSLAVKALYEYFQSRATDRLPTDDEIRMGILAANQAIFEANQQDLRSGSGRMGTTLVLAIVHDSKVAIAHVGDSRIYRLSRRRGLEQLTLDHEVGQREIQRGIDPEAAYSRPDAYQLTQALGPRDNDYIEPDVQFFELDEDTLLLLCSDGLSDNNLVETHWQTHLAPLLSSRANLEQGVTQLVELANQHNGHDNITALIARAKVQPNIDLARL